MSSLLGFVILLLSCLGDYSPICIGHWKCLVHGHLVEKCLALLWILQSCCQFTNLIDCRMSAYTPNLLITLIHLLSDLSNNLHLCTALLHLYFNAHHNPYWLCLLHTYNPHTPESSVHCRAPCPPCCSRPDSWINCLALFLLSTLWSKRLRF